MREVRIPCTVAGTLISASARVSCTAPLRASVPSSNSACTISSMKNGLPSVRSAIIRLSAARLARITEQRGEQLLDALTRQRIEAQLRIVSAVAPLVAILGAVVDQQQNARIGERVGEQVQPGLGFAVNPMEVFEHDDQRLVEALAQHDSFERFLRAPPPRLHVHLRKRILAFLDAEQHEEVWQRVFEALVEREQFADHLFAALAAVVGGVDSEVAVKHFDNRQIGRSLAV